jgi:hypothetical protein
VPVADKVLEGVTRIRLDASVVSAHSDKELAEPNFKGLWPPPAHISWSRTTDRNARTRPAREAFLRRFEREVDPDGVLPPAERGRRAQHALRAYMLGFAKRSMAARCPE